MTAEQTEYISAETDAASSSLKKSQRCINLDWLEVDVLEPAKSTRDIEYFRSLDMWCSDRGYGTRVHAEMFVINDSEGHPFIEIRRKPKTPLLPENDAHLRLHNRTCYMEAAARILADFIREHGYKFLRVVRADICLDFEYFDSGDDPNKFLKRYVDGTYSKINQANVSAHGTDRWEGRFWNSFSWGSPSSQIGTKMYNKTMELYDAQSGQFKKPYIRQAWLECDLIDDWFTCTKIHQVQDASGVLKAERYRPAIWRIEFSIRSSTKRWFTIEKDGKEGNYHSIANTLEMYDTRPKLLVLFASLAQHYFRFKHYEPGKVKYKCKDKHLFDFTGEQTIYTLHCPVLGEKAAPRPITSLINKLKALRDRKHEKELKAACNVIIDYLNGYAMSHELNTPFSREELEALHIATSWKFKGDQRELKVLIEEVKHLLSIHDDIF